MNEQHQRTLEAYRHLARLVALYGDDIPELLALFSRYEREAASLLEKEDAIERARRLAGIAA